MSSLAVDAAAIGVYNPGLAHDMVQTATVGAVVGAQDAARSPASSSGLWGAGPVTYGGGGEGADYASALAGTSAQAQAALMTLASQNQLLETLARTM